MAAPSVRQFKSALSGGSDPQSLSFDTQPVVGNYVVAFGIFTTGAPAFSDNQSNSYAAPVTVTNGDVNSMGMSYAKIATTGTPFTVNVTKNTSGGGVMILEIQNASGVTFLDGTPGTGSQTGFSATSVSIGCGICTNTNDLQLAAFQTFNDPITITWHSPLVFVGNLAEVGGLLANSAAGTIGGIGGASTAVADITGGTSSYAGIGMLIRAIGPIISSQPASQSLAPATAATFSVVATGTGGLTYQWSKNGVTIGGATSSSYQTDVLLLSDNQSYWTVNVTDSLGTTTSLRAYVTITPPLIISMPILWNNN